MERQKNALIIILFLILGLALGYYFGKVQKDNNQPNNTITSFEECAAAGYPVAESYPRQCRTSDGKLFVEEIGHPDWQNTTDSQTGASFSFPRSLNTTYVEATDWPPQIQILNEEYKCEQAGAVTARAGETKEISINGNNYCQTKIVGGAAGSTYTEYAYAFDKNNKTAILTFTLRTVQCENYDQPRQQECKNEQNSFDVNNLVDQIAQTVNI